MKHEVLTRAAKLIHPWLAIIVSTSILHASVNCGGRQFYKSIAKERLPKTDCDIGMAWDLRLLYCESMSHLRKIRRVFNVSLVSDEFVIC